MKIKTKIWMVLLIVVVASLVNIISAEEKDSDFDGIPDSTDMYPFDYDNDKMPDIWEKKHGLRYEADDGSEDPDNDGIKNVDEYQQGTDPLVSDKTNQRVQPPEFFSRVERTMLKWLVWFATTLALLVILLFVLFRKNIFRILRYMHLMSKEHFEKKKIKAIPQANQVLEGSPQFMPPRRIIRPHPRPFRMPLKNVETRKYHMPKKQKMSVRESYRKHDFEDFKKKQTVKKIPKPVEKPVTAPRKEGKQEDIFTKLSQKVEEHKISKGGRLQKLASIR